MPADRRYRLITTVGLVAAIVGCSPAPAAVSSPAPAAPMVPTAAASVQPTPAPTQTRARFPTALFAALDEQPVSAGLATRLQGVLERDAKGHGLTATVITPAGTWSGATGMATPERAMVPDDQLAIASITKTIVAAQVLKLVESGRLGLDDLAADRLPPGLDFDTNGARVVDLLSMRTGIPEYDTDDVTLENDPLHAWTAAEKLARVAPERGPVGRDWE